MLKMNKMNNTIKKPSNELGNKTFVLINGKIPKALKEAASCQSGTTSQGIGETQTCGSSHSLQGPHVGSLVVLPPVAPREPAAFESRVLK